MFHEDRIFRIDHYLGKEAVQNLLALRFANSLFEPLWNASSIDNVQITVAETVGLEGRTGLLRRIRRAARHGAEPHAAARRAGRDGAAAPVRAERSAQREDQGDAQPAADHRGHRRCQHRAWPVHRGQRRRRRRAGLQRGDRARKGDSDTETFVALRAEIDNWRWAGVPFYLRTGKRMQSRRTDIAIQFKSVPHNIFAADEPNLQANRLVIHLQPQESVTLEILSKQPGLEGVRLREVPARALAAQGRERRPHAHRVRAPAARCAQGKHDAVRAARRGRGGVALDRRHPDELALDAPTGEAVSCGHLGAHGRDRSDRASRP